MAEWGKVVSVKEIRKLGPTNEIETWYRYQVTTKGGITFSQLVPAAEATEAKLLPILRARAVELDKTLTL